MEATYPPTTITWILVVFGVITCLPLVTAQLIFLVAPKSRKAKDILIGKGEGWRDKTHFKSSYGMAWADWIVLLPFLTTGSVGVLLGTVWGYLLWSIAGALSLYINIILWFMEREYVYPSRGPVAYYTYYWGNFVYWGALAVVYSLLRLAGFTL